MIVCAAVKIEERIYRGLRHCDAFKAAIKAGEIAPITLESEGFIDDQGIFLSRREAWDHAVKCGQIKPAENGHTHPLRSNDLY